LHGTGCVVKVGNSKVNVYQYLMAMNPRVGLQHSLLLFRELLVTS